MNCSMFSCSHFSNFLSDPFGKQSVLSKRGQETTSSEGSTMAKPKPMVPAKAKPVNFVLEPVKREGKSPVGLWISGQSSERR